jgi:hypothetical protein
MPRLYNWGEEGPMPTLGRIALTAIALAGSVYLTAQQKAPADITKEQHHRLLLENQLVRVFAVALAPHQETFVQYEHNFLRVALQDGDVVMWRAGESDVLHYPVKQGQATFFIGGDVLGLRNESNAEYKNITVEFLDPGVTNYGYRWQTGKWDYGSSAINAPLDPHSHFVNQLDLGMAVVSDVQLLSKESLGAPTQEWRELVIAVTPLELSNGNRAKVRLAAGEVLWLDRRLSRLVNLGAEPARFVLIALAAS